MTVYEVYSLQFSLCHYVIPERKIVFVLWIFHRGSLCDVLIVSCLSEDCCTVLFVVKVGCFAMFSYSCISYLVSVVHCLVLSVVGCQQCWAGLIPGAVEYTNCIAFLQRGKTLPMIVLDMMLNHVIMRLQFWSSGECRVFLHSHYSQVHSDPEWKYLLGSHLRIKSFNHSRG